MVEEKLKYTKAWDNVLQTWVTPEQVSKSDAHDRNRYFSEQFDINEDKGKVLTLHKQSKNIVSKTGKVFNRKTHFSAIAENTKEYRKNTAKKAEHQESIVHKLCKSEIKNIKFIKIPAVTASIIGEDIQLISEQYAKVINVKGIQCKDENTNRIPDAIIQIELLGKVQEFYLEFYYKHAVDENKRRQYQYHKINCLEVDLSDLRDNLDETENSLRKKINKLISEEAYWISCRAKEIIEREAQKQFVIEISKQTQLLRDTEYYSRTNLDNRDCLYQRMYIFKDELTNRHKLEESHPCYFIADPAVEYIKEQKCTDIGQCLGCNNCVFISNYTAENTNLVKIFCKKNVDMNKVNPTQLLNNIYNKMLKLLDKED